MFIILPKYRVIADFRKDNSEALENVFKSFVSLCMKLNLYGKELIVVDGTKLEASASKRNHYSRNKLKKMKELAEAAIREYLHEIDKNDNADSTTDNKILVEKIKHLEEKIGYYDDLDNKLVKSEEVVGKFTKTAYFPDIMTPAERIAAGIIK